MFSERRAFWFKLRTRGDCEAAIRAGVLLAFMSALCKGVALLVYVGAAASERTILLAMLADIVTLVLLAVFVLRRSRLAAFALLLYLVFTWIAVWALGAPSGWGFQTAAALVLVNYVLLGSLAILATLKWHNHFTEAGEENRIAS